MSAPKCVKCEKTAYSQESITYDLATYHNACFRCKNCTNTLSLRAVAKIQGDLYCKVCFLRMFSEKGTYHVFGEKTLPRNMRLTVDSNDDPSVKPKPSTTDPSPKSVVHKSVTGAPAAGNNGSSSPRASGSSSPRSHVSSSSAGALPSRVWSIEKAAGAPARAPASPRDGAPEGLDEMFAAVRSKNVKAVQDIIDKFGVRMLLHPVNKQTVVQFAFGAEGSPACGAAMVEALADHYKDLEAEVQMLQTELQA